MNIDSKTFSAAKDIQALIPIRKEILCTFNSTQLLDLKQRWWEIYRNGGTQLSVLSLQVCINAVIEELGERDAHEEGDKTVISGDLTLWMNAGENFATWKDKEVLNPCKRLIVPGTGWMDEFNVLWNKLNEVRISRAKSAEDKVRFELINSLVAE